MKLDLNDFANVSISNLEVFLTADNHPIYVKYLNELATEGDIEAAEKLFNVYFWGDEYTHADQSKALELFGLFAKKNHSTQAARILADHYQNYVDNEGSDQRAVHWLQFAESLLDGESAFELGKAYYYGWLNLEEDENRAIEHFERSIKYGFDRGYSKLAKIFLNSESEAQHTRGKELLISGAKIGNADCQFELAKRYLTGENFSKDEKYGISWLLKAAEQNHLEALIKLGEMHLSGEVLEKNAYEGFCSIERAALRHSKIGQARLSSLYLLGVGVEQNLTIAHAWIRIAELNFGHHGPSNMSFTGEILKSHMLTEAQKKHSDTFVSNFIKDDLWRYRFNDQ